MFRPCSLIRLQKNKLEKERVSHSKEFDGKKQGQAESMGTTPDADVAMMLLHAIFVTGRFFLSKTPSRRGCRLGQVGKLPSGAVIPSASPSRPTRGGFHR